MKLGETRTITVDISGIKSLVVVVGDTSTNVQVSNIYFHN